jgi:hypothetical protein
MNTTQKQTILKIAGAEGIDTTLINYEKAIQIAKVLGLTGSDFDDMFQKMSFNGECQLKRWIDRIFPLTDMGVYAKYIADSNMSDALKKNDPVKIAQATREQNAAAALNRGDISDAFRSLNYFMDR